MKTNEGIPELNPWWITGFVDGEGCFSISFIKNATMRLGYQIFVEFVLTQGEKSLPSLEAVQCFFDCGKIYRNRRKDNHKEDLFRYCVRARADLLDTIIPFFEEYPLQTAKKDDFEVFRWVMRMIERGEHLTPEGFETIRQLSATTNRRKVRELSTIS